ncbi:hypothetical protein HDF12_000345 [Edaphobacter lichenicola]|uniref:Uncharacterized protein n=1 Tax=Tunturiibacter lichenicola TaxID=2051959 RepID=A0A7Y9T7X1_9BACT|nr:hypothetical protein [Edaphobacter lichenicola]
MNRSREGVVGRAVDASAEKKGGRVSAGGGSGVIVGRA